MEDRWVIFTPTFTYGPFLTGQAANAAPVAVRKDAEVRKATQVDLATIAEQDAELDERD